MVWHVELNWSEPTDKREKIQQNVRSKWTEKENNTNRTLIIYIWVLCFNMRMLTEYANVLHRSKDWPAVRGWWKMKCVSEESRFRVLIGAVNTSSPWQGDSQTCSVRRGSSLSQQLKFQRIPASSDCYQIHGHSERFFVKLPEKIHHRKSIQYFQIQQWWFADNGAPTNQKERLNGSICYSNVHYG